MYISRMRFNPRRTATCGIYGMHQDVWRLFADSPNRKRDFIYRQDDNVVFAVSERKPEDDSCSWIIETKDYAPVVSEGEIFSFSLRVNPVVRSRKSGKWQKHDAIQHERKKRLEEGDNADRFLVAQEVVVSWLQKREEQLGLNVASDSVLIENYLFNQKMHKVNGKQGNISFVDVQGICTVTDVTAFQKTLFAGIGSAKAFGCGLLLVRRR